MGESSEDGRLPALRCSGWSGIFAFRLLDKPTTAPDSAEQKSRAGQRERSPEWPQITAFRQSNHARGYWNPGRNNTEVKPCALPLHPRRNLQREISDSEDQSQNAHRDFCLTVLLRGTRSSGFDGRGYGLDYQWLFFRDHCSKGFDVNFSLGFSGFGAPF